MQEIYFHETKLGVLLVLRCGIPSAAEYSRLGLFCATLVALPCACLPTDSTAPYPVLCIRSRPYTLCLMLPDV